MRAEILGLFVSSYLVIGAGFAGSVLAERLARVCGHTVVVVERRSHIGGNAYDFEHDTGLRIAAYGPHVFHTNSRRIYHYLSTFTTWRPYEHRVLSAVDGMLVPFPINLDTLNHLYGFHWDPREAQAFLARQSAAWSTPRNAEEHVLSLVGRDLYDKFFRYYTWKQWGMDPRCLPASVTARIPVRCNRDGRYFTDRFQCMPADGYTKMFERMLSHPRITVCLNTDYQEVDNPQAFARIIYTGSIDEYYEYMLGRLPYRSIRCEHEVISVKRWQPVAQVNYPQDEAFTRITEHKHMTGQTCRETVVTREYPGQWGERCYPVPTGEARRRYAQYRALAQKSPRVVFAGRLGAYRYYNMDQVVAQSLAMFERLRRADPKGSSGSEPEGGDCFGTMTTSRFGGIISEGVDGAS